jgi:hypothetical protein
MPQKKTPTMLQYKSKIPSNIAQTWTIGEKPKQTLPEHSRRGLGGQAVKVKKANGGCLDDLGDKGGISVREGPRIILYSEGPPFRW